MFIILFIFIFIANYIENVTKMCLEKISVLFQYLMERETCLWSEQSREYAALPIPLHPKL